MLSTPRWLALDRPRQLHLAIQNPTRYTWPVCTPSTDLAKARATSSGLLHG